MSKAEATESKRVYWHHELPPADAQAMDEHMVEASSRHIPNTMAHGDELWRQCYDDLMARTQERLEQEIVRMGGVCAHVLSESVESRRNDVAGEAWLHGRFSYMLYKQAPKAP